MRHREPLPYATRHSGVLDAMAECRDCTWEASNRKNAMATANLHARRTGHEVHVEQTIGVTYNRKDRDDD